MNEFHQRNYGLVYYGEKGTSSYPYNHASWTYSRYMDSAGYADIFSFNIIILIFAAIGLLSSIALILKAAAIHFRPQEHVLTEWQAFASHIQLICVWGCTALGGLFMWRMVHGGDEDYQLGASWGLCFTAAVFSTGVFLYYKRVIQYSSKPSAADVQPSPEASAASIPLLPAASAVDVPMRNLSSNARTCMDSTCCDI